jgi:hypothetical protein
VVSAYRLTYSECLVLAVLLQLPVQPRSVLGDWFRIQEFPELTEDLLANSLAALKDKGYYFPNQKSQPIAPALIRSLMLLSLNPGDITIFLRRHGRSALTRFAQMKRSVAQYSIGGEHLYIYPIIRQSSLAEIILPEWFLVCQNEGLQAEMSPGAFHLFSQTCALIDLAAAETDFQTSWIKKSKLFEPSTFANDWLDVFYSPEQGDAPKRLEQELRWLISERFLAEGGDSSGAIEIGERGKALSATLSDPDMAILTVSLQLWQDDFPETGVFLFGGGRLFLLDIWKKPGSFLIRQVGDRQEGSAWVKDLLEAGSTARRADYVIPTVA